MEGEGVKSDTSTKWKQLIGKIAENTPNFWKRKKD
jgi:hypothetical protein